MKYPRDFPEHLRRKVDRAIALAEVAFADALREGGPSARDRATLAFLKTIWCAWAQQCREAARLGLWRTARVRQETDRWYESEFLWALLVSTHLDKQMPESLDRDVLQKIRDSGEWRNHQSELAVIADMPVPTSSTATSQPDGLAVAAQDRPKNGAATTDDAEGPGTSAAEASHLQRSQYIFRRSTHGWEIAFAGPAKIVPNRRGMALIHILLQKPHEPIGSEILTGPMLPASSENTKHLPDEGFQSRLSSGIPVLDTRARREAEARLEEIKKERQCAIDDGDREKVETLEEEALGISKNLKAATRRHGRSRLMGSEVDVARKRASAQFQRALDLLTKQDPALAQHLKDFIKPGTSFVYRPRLDIDWQT